MFSAKGPLALGNCGKSDMPETMWLLALGLFRTLETHALQKMRTLRLGGRSVLQSPFYRAGTEALAQSCPANQRQNYN